MTTHRRPLTETAQHCCPARGCGVHIPNSRLLCAWHWGRLPQSIKDAVNTTYQAYRATYSQEDYWTWAAAKRAAIVHFRPAGEEEQKRD